LENLSREGLIDELYHANYRAVLSTCARILRKREDAADAAQQVFLIALESLDLTLTRSAARAWLLTVARNHCIDLLRRRKRLGKALVTLGTDGGRAPDMETAVADRDFVSVVFKQLSKRERQALWHSAVESRPLADIAGRLRLSYMAAAQVLHRARRHAVQVAARVAVVLGIFHLGRQRPAGASALVARLVAVTAVPLIVVSVQSSSAARQPPAAPARASVSAAAPSLVGGSPASAGVLGGTGVVPAGLQASAPGIGAASGSLVSESTATLNTAVIAVRQLLKSIPSVPPALGTQAPVPLGSAAPSPPAIQ
jgi:RNA polymerase sigma-70 factor, ECF subfamily